MKWKIPFYKVLANLKIKSFKFKCQVVFLHFLRIEVTLAEQLSGSGYGVPILQAKTPFRQV